MEQTKTKRTAKSKKIKETENANLKVSPQITVRESEGETIDIPLINPPKCLIHAMSKGNIKDSRHAFNELADNMLDSLQKLLAGVRRMDFTIKAVEDGSYDITASDNGIGVQVDDIPLIFRIGNGKDDGLHEHGTGLKNVIAFFCGSGPNWQVVSVPQYSNTAYVIDGPYDHPLKLRPVTNTEELHPFKSGLTVRFRTKPNKLMFGTISTLDTLLVWIKESLGVVYSRIPLRDDPKTNLEMRLNGILVKPILPECFLRVKELKLKESLDTGCLPAEISIRLIKLTAPNAETKFYYRKSMKSSGIYIWRQHRLIQVIPVSEIWTEFSQHNSFNPVVLDLEFSGPPEACPPTISTKNAIDMNDNRTKRLFQIVRDNIPKELLRDNDTKNKTEAALKEEHEAMRRKQYARDPCFRYEREVTKMLPDGKQTPSFDALEYVNIGGQSIVNLYEAKRDNSNVSMAYVEQIFRNYLYLRKVAEMADRKIECVILSNSKDYDQRATSTLSLYKEICPDFNLTLETWSDYNIRNKREDGEE